MDGTNETPLCDDCLELLTAASSPAAGNDPSRESHVKKCDRCRQWSAMVTPAITRMRAERHRHLEDASKPIRAEVASDGEDYGDLANRVAAMLDAEETERLAEQAAVGATIGLVTRSPSLETDRRGLLHWGAAAALVVIATTVAGVISQTEVSRLDSRYQAGQLRSPADALPMLRMMSLPPSCWPVTLHGSQADSGTRLCSARKDGAAATTDVNDTNPDHSLATSPAVTWDSCGKCHSGNASRSGSRSVWCCTQCHSVPPTKNQIREPQEATLIAACLACHR